PPSSACRRCSSTTWASRAPTLAASDPRSRCRSSTAVACAASCAAPKPTTRRRSRITTAPSSRHCRTSPTRQPARSCSARRSRAPMNRSRRRAKPGKSRATAITAASRPTSTCSAPKRRCSRACAPRPTSIPAPSRSTLRWFVRSAAATRIPNQRGKCPMSKMEPEVEQAAAQAQADARNTKRRKRLFLVLGGVVLKAALGYGIYAYGYAARYVSTDNAYTGAETAQVTPAIGGIVREVVVTDDTDARLALDQAEAELGRAVRRVRGYVANDQSLAAQIAARSSDEKRAAAQVESAIADYDRAELDLMRRQALVTSGSVSGDELTKARNAFETAKANLAAAYAQAAQSRANRTAAIGSREANAVLIANATEETN